MQLRSPAVIAARLGRVTVSSAGVLVALLSACSDPGVSSLRGQGGQMADDEGTVLKGGAFSDGGDTLVPHDGAATSAQDAGGADGATGGPGGGPGVGGKGPAIPAGSATRTYDAAGRSRSAIVYAPAGLTGPAPLVVLLHGNGDTSSNFVAALGFRAKADAQKFIFVAPQGVSQSFTYLGQQLNVSWDAYRKVNEGNIDLPLLEAIRGDVGASSSVDTKRVFVFGYSQGGYLAFRWGMEAAASLSCASVNAASNPLPGSPLVSQAARKIPVMLQVGTNDFAISGARSTSTQLMNAGFPATLNEIQGAGHVPFPGGPDAPLNFCLSRSL